MKSLEGRNLLGNPVQIKQVEEVKAEDLLACIKGYVKGEPKIAVILDNAPIPAKDQVVSDLEKIADVTVFSNVKPNPYCRDINKMHSDFKNANAVIGIGGGSVLDSAKALAMLAVNGGTLEDYLGNSPKKKIQKKSLPLILIPTTAGTGSEMTKVGVYTTDSGRKFTLGSDLMHARTAFLTVSFILTSPAGLVASTGLDALDHALESIWNKNATDDTRSLAEEAAIDVLKNLPTVYECAKKEKPVDIDSYANQQAASTMAGAAFSLTGTAAGHALSFILSEDYHVPHGAACAFTLMDLFELSKDIPSVKSSLARISSALETETDQEKLVELLEKRINGLLVKMNIPTTFTELGVNISKEEIDSHFERSFDDPKMWNQIPKATKENIYPFLKSKC